MSLAILTNQFSLILVLIDKIQNPEDKEIYLHKLQELISNENPQKIKPPPKTDFSKIMNMFDSSNCKVSISDLKHEVRQLKKEVKTLKENHDQLQQEI